MHNQPSNPTIDCAVPASFPRLFTAPKVEVSVVVPCFNEGPVLAHLATTLASVQTKLAHEYDLHFVFVDDGSGDGTWEGLCDAFANWPNALLLRHEQNRGVAAAIRTGITAARTEIVCSMDSDCTYDPHELGKMIPLLTDEVDLVTASPYHPQGAVRNVPGWRLWLSKGSSFLYRRVLRHKLYTYTSCFRVYRRRAVLDLPETADGFQGIPELLALLDLKGAGIVEYPATLDVRRFGQSKMKIARTIRAHLFLLARLLSRRVRKTLGVD